MIKPFLPLLCRGQYQNTTQHKNRLERHQTPYRPTYHKTDLHLFAPLIVYNETMKHKHKATNKQLYNETQEQRNTKTNSCLTVYNETQMQPRPGLDQG